MSMCSFDKELLTSYHDKQLSVSEMDAVAAHLQTCEECKRTVEDYASLSSMLRSVDAPKVSVQTESEKIMSSPALRRERNIIKFSKYLEFAVVAAACLLVAFISFSVVNAPKKVAADGSNPMARSTETRTPVAVTEGERRPKGTPESAHAAREIAKTPPETSKGSGTTFEEDRKKSRNEDLAINGKIEETVSKEKEAAPQENEWGITADASEAIDDVLVLNCVDVNETQKAVTEFVLQNGNMFRRAGSNEYVVELDPAQQEQLLAFVGSNCKNKVTWSSGVEEFALGAPAKGANVDRNAIPGTDLPEPAKQDEKAKGFFSGKSAEPQSKPQNPQQPPAGKGGDLAVQEKRESKKSPNDQTLTHSAGDTLAPNQQAQKIVQKGEATQEETLEKLDKNFAQKEGGDKKDQFPTKSALAEQNKIMKEEEKTADKIVEIPRSEQLGLVKENLRTVEDLVAQLRLNRGRWTFGNRGGKIGQRKASSRQVLLLLNRSDEPAAERALKQSEKSEGK